MFAPIAFSRTQSSANPLLRSRVARGIAASTAFALTLGMVALAGPAAVADEETPAPIAPVAVDDAATVTKLTETWITVTDNDSDADSLFYLTEVSQPAGGQIFAVENTRFLYKSKPGFVGVDTVSYRLKDVSGLYSEWATVSITVPNADPVAVDDTATGAKNVMSTGKVTDNDSDPEGDALTVTWGTPSHAGFTGISSGYWQWILGTFEGVVTVPYTLHDGYGGTDEGVLTVSVPIYGTDTPVAAADAYSMTQDTVLTVAAPGVMVNDHDPDGSPFHAMIIPASIDHGTLVGDPDGSFTYTPEPGFVGTDTFIYQVIDVDLHKSTAQTVTITVLPAVAPVAVADSYWTAQNQLITVNGAGVLTNDTDAVSAAKVSDPSHGSLSLGADGKFSYQPDADFVGTDTFQYRAVNAAGQSAPVNVTIEVGGSKPGWFQPPIAVADSASTVKNQDVVIDLLSNDDIPAGGSGTIVIAATGADHGEVISIDQANGTVTYRPDAGYAGADSFFYRIYDYRGVHSGWAAVTLNVQDDTNQAPVVTNLEVTRIKGLPQWTFGNAYDLVNDPEGNDVTITWGAAPAVGQLLTNINAFGNWQWLPPMEFVGVEVIHFTATDSLGASTPGTITITVVEDPLDPIAGADTYSTTVGTPLTVNAANGLFANDTDVDSQWQDMQVFTETSGLDGTVDVAADGSFTFQPTPGFNGTTAFSYRLLDDTGRYSNWAKVTIHVGAIPNAVPVALPDAYSVPQDGQLLVASAEGLLANDSDPDPTPLAVAGNTITANGALTVMPDGSLEYTPNVGFVGTDTFEYSVTDGIDTSANATVTITVTAVEPGQNGGGENGGGENGGGENGGEEQPSAPADKPEHEEVSSETPAKGGTKQVTDASGTEAETLAEDGAPEATATSADVDEAVKEETDEAPAADSDAAAQAAEDAAPSLPGLVWLAMIGASAGLAIALWIARRLRARSNAA